jgi:hypothetical protein
MGDTGQGLLKARRDGPAALPVDLQMVIDDGIGEKQIQLQTSGRLLVAFFGVSPMLPNGKGG